MEQLNNAMVYVGLPKSVQHDISGIKIKPEVIYDIIIEVVLNHYGIDISRFFNNFKCRDAIYVEIRQVIFYFAKKYTDFPLKEIGLKLFKDHSTVIFSINSIKNLCDVYPEFRNKINEINCKIVAKLYE